MQVRLGIAFDMDREFERGLQGGPSGQKDHYRRTFTPPFHGKIGHNYAK